MPVADYTPSLADVGAIDMARTRDDVGNETGTFTATTRPTDAQVNVLINRALDLDIRPKIGEDIPADLFDAAKQLAALRVAMYIELTYFASEVANDRSPYPQYKELYDEQLPILVNAIEAEEAGDSPLNPVGENIAQFSFPAPTNWMEGKM